MSSPMSRVLFLSETGTPMRFFLRPGATKTQLQPIISAGGGVVCKVQEPNAILLMDPDSIINLPASTASRYVSSQYILDCMEMNQQLDVDDYRFRDDSIQIGSAKTNRRGSGRMGYSEEEDAAILRFVQGHKQEVNGNLLWKRMEREAITSHSWQSMKDRYRKHLAKLEGHTEERQNAGAMEGSSTKLFGVPLQQNDPPKSSHHIDPLTPSPEGVQLQLSSEESDTNCSPEQTHPQPSADPTSPQPSPERPRLQCSPAKIQPAPSPCKKHLQPPLDQTHPQPSPEVIVPPAVSEQTNPLILPHKIHLCAEAVQPHSLAGEGSAVGNDVPGPSMKSAGAEAQLVVAEKVLEEDEKRPARKKRKLGILERAVMEFEDLDESDDDTLDIELSSTKSADHIGLPKEIPVVIQENDSNDSKENGQPQSEKGPNGHFGPPDKDKGPEMNRESDYEGDEDNDSNKENSGPPPEKTAGVHFGPPDKDGGPAFDQEIDDEDDDDDNGTNNGEPQTETAPDVYFGAPGQDKGSKGSGLAPESLPPFTSKVHMFLFDQELQEEEEATSQPACDLPFTQAQLEHAREQLRYLMKKSGQGLDCVSKALLKNSGDVQAALQYLSGQQVCLWDPRDDVLLSSSGTSLLHLEKKYGKVAVARRIAFLEIE